MPAQYESGGLSCHTTTIVRPEICATSGYDLDPSPHTRRLSRTGARVCAPRTRTKRARALYRRGSQPDC
jgi:hypothetical protein